MYETDGKWGISDELGGNLLVKKKLKHSVLTKQKLVYEIVIYSMYYIYICIHTSKIAYAPISTDFQYVLPQHLEAESCLWKVQEDGDLVHFCSLGIFCFRKKKKWYFLGGTEV